MKKAPGYDGHCRSLTPEQVKEKLEAGEAYVIRLKMPYEGDSVVKDGLRGEVRFENSKIDDQILLKSDGFPTYHLANVVDDHLMGITHVIRAEEWIASTPKHIQLYKAFGWDEPEWYHMPLLRKKIRTKISKR
jgi:glutamyl-tRNA synthetase